MIFLYGLTRAYRRNQLNLFLYRAHAKKTLIVLKLRAKCIGVFWTLMPNISLYSKENIQAVYKHHHMKPNFNRLNVMAAQAAHMSCRDMSLIKTFPISMMVSILEIGSMILASNLLKLWCIQIT